MLRQLVASGFLSIDIRGYGGLSLTDKGLALLKGAAEFCFRPDSVRQPARAAHRKERTEAEALDDTALSLLQELKRLRLALARECAVPAYVIFSDGSLIDMAGRRPATREDFAKIFRIGHAKLEQFADVFLDAIAGFAGRA